MGEGEPMGRMRRKQTTIPELEAAIGEMWERFRGGEVALAPEIQILQKYLNRRRAKERRLAEQGKSTTVTTLKPKSKK